MVENDLMLHHAREDVLDEHLEHHFVDIGGQATLVRKDFIKQESGVLQRHKHHILQSDQVVERKAP